MPKRPAFTLVELLVVIGIIALLISILIPTLGSAQRQARATKCAAHLREMFNAMQYYSQEFKGYYPVAQYGGVYNLYGDLYPIGGSNAYYPNFIAKYVTKSKYGTSSTNAQDAGYARQSVLWGCPAWDGYQSTTVGGINRVQNGLGMNPYPTFKPDKYTNTFPPLKERALGGTFGGNFQKANAYSDPSRKMLIADSKFWMSESNPAPVLTSYPPAVVAQEGNNNVNTYTPGSVGQTMIDLYRHGKYPPLQPARTTYDPNKGKISFNILYADGHVVQTNDAREAYLSLRMKFPR